MTMKMRIATIALASLGAATLLSYAVAEQALKIDFSDEAVGAEPSDEVEPGTVVREVRRGWRLPAALSWPWTLPRLTILLSRPAISRFATARWASRFCTTAVCGLVRVTVFCSRARLVVGNPRLPPF